MGRAKRAADGVLVYHALNRSNGRLPIFDDDDDYPAFERILWESAEGTGTDVLAFCLMPNHWEQGTGPYLIFRSMTIDVTAVNDAPIQTAGTIASQYAVSPLV